MTDINHRFIPLDSDSQGDTENVLFYDREASLEAIYNCATGRIQAVINLHTNLYEYHNCEPSILHAVAVISALLLNDAYSLLDQFAPKAIKHKIDKNQL